MMRCRKITGSLRGLFILPLLMLLTTGCGVGSCSLSAGRADSGCVCVLDDTSYDVAVRVDGQTYSVNTVKTKAYKPGRNIRKTAENSITVPAGQHNVEVLKGGEVLVSKKIIVSAGETKIIEL